MNLIKFAYVIEDLPTKLSKLRTRIIFYAIKYPFVLIYFSAIFGIELYDFVGNNFFWVFVSVAVFFAVCFIISEKFRVFPFVSLLFYFYVLFLDNPGKIFIGEVSDVSSSSYLISSIFSKDDLDAKWKKSGVYVRVFGVRESIDILDRVFLICGRTYRVRTGFYICNAIYVRKLRTEGISRFFISLREKGISVIRLSEERAFLETLIFAGRSDIDRNIFFDFSKLGIAHMIAISGSHFASIALIGYFVGYAISLLVFRVGYVSRIQPFMVKIFFSVLFQVLFLAMCGFVKPAQRAFIMTSIFSLAILSGRPYNAINTLHLSGFVIILFNPYDIWNISFLLSYGGVLFLILFTPQLKNKFALIFSSSVFGSFGVFPALVQSGIPISYISPFANIIFAPLFSVLISLGAFGVFLGFIFEPLAIFPIMVADILVNFIVNIAQILAPFADLLAVSVRYNVRPEVLTPVLALPFFVAKKVLTTRNFIIFSSLLYFFSILLISIYGKERIYSLQSFLVREVSDLDGVKFYALPLRENISEKAILNLEKSGRVAKVKCVYICGSESVNSTFKSAEFIFRGRKIHIKIPACEDSDLCEFGILR